MQVLYAQNSFNTTAIKLTSYNKLFSAVAKYLHATGSSHHYLEPNKRANPAENMRLRDKSVQNYQKMCILWGSSIEKSRECKAGYNYISLC